MDKEERKLYDKQWGFRHYLGDTLYGYIHPIDQPFTRIASRLKSDFGQYVVSLHNRSIRQRRSRKGSKK